MRKLIVIAVALATISCSRDIQNSEAVKQGVMDYLRAGKTQTGLNVDAMQVEVRSVSFQRDEARANVYITPKGMPTGGMQLNYVLARNGNRWVVRGRTESGANPHGGSQMQQQLPSGHPQVAPDGEPPSGALPPGHPQVQPGAPSGLPPGHPPTGAKSTGPNQ